MITEQQRENLKKLADYLAALPDDYKQFEMRAFSSENDDEGPPIKVVCGTAGCAVGHGPNAGLSQKRHKNWLDYCDHYFVYSESPAFDWMFGGDWSTSDNTPQGAAERIYIYLATGLPSDYEEQMYGQIPLQYIPGESA